MITPFLAAAGSPQILIPALVSFVLGYIMYGMIFMALGSLCDTIQEAQTLLSPMMILLMLPMFAIFIAFQDPGSPVVDFATWIPVFTPFLLILRMPHDPPMWEVALQMGLMVVTTLAVLWDLRPRLPGRGRQRRQHRRPRQDAEGRAGEEGGLNKNPARSL
jgi:ABC-2 type transport system permease protein